MASLGLLANYGSSSSENESDSEDDSSAANSPHRSEHEAAGNEKKKLPSPFVSDVNSKSSDGSQISGSVFSNPFREAEEHQTSVLEKHVKMTVPSNKVSALNGRQICWNYRKGRCRFGHNCKFAHDSDVPLENIAANLNNNTPALQANQPDAWNNKQVTIESTVISESKEELELVTKKRKKRAGLVEGLIPPKKALKAYFGQQSPKFIFKTSK